jgi:hypothetical protein
MIRKLNPKWKKPIEDFDYILVESPHEPGRILIRILSAPYSGVVYSYNQVSLKENQELGVAILAFNFQVYSSGNHGIGKLEGDSKFTYYIGEVLSSILSQSDGRVGRLTNGNNNSKTNFAGFHSQ